MSHLPNHQYGSGRPSGNLTPNPANYQVTGGQGQIISNTRNHRPSMNHGIQYNQYVDYGETIPSQPFPRPAGFQAPQYGGRLSDGQYYQRPARFQGPQLGHSFTSPNNTSPMVDAFGIHQYENHRPQQGPEFSDWHRGVPSVIGLPQGHHYTVVGQDFHGLTNTDCDSANAAVPPYHPLAVQGLSRTRGPQSFSQTRPLQTTNAPSVRQGFQGQPARLYMPRVPSYTSPQNSLGNVEMGEGRRGTWRVSSLDPSSGNVARVKATEQRSYPTQTIQHGNGRNQYHPNGPYNTASQPDGPGEHLCKDVIPKLYDESLKAVQAGDIQVRQNRPSEGGSKRKRVRFASPDVEEAFEPIHKRTKVKHHLLPPQRVTAFPVSSMADQSPHMAFHVDPIPPYQANSRKRERLDSPTDQGEESAPSPKRQKIQADKNQAESVGCSFGEALDLISKVSIGRRLTAEEVGPMTFWLRVLIKPRDTRPSNNRSLDVKCTVVPEDHDYHESSELAPMHPRNQSPDVGCKVPKPEDHDYDESSGLIRAQYVELLRPLTQEQIDLSKDDNEDYFSTFENDYVYK